MDLLKKFISLKYKFNFTIYFVGLRISLDTINLTSIQCSLQIIILYCAKLNFYFFQTQSKSKQCNNRKVTKLIMYVVRNIVWHQHFSSFEHFAGFIFIRHRVSYIV